MITSSACPLSPLGAPLAAFLLWTKEGIVGIRTQVPSPRPVFGKSGALASASCLPLQAGLSSSKALPLTKVVQNDAYTAPALPASVRTKALTHVSRTLVNKEEPPKELPPAEVSIAVWAVCCVRPSGSSVL